MTERKHPNGGDMYTPITPEIKALFWRMRAEHGSWRKVAALSNTRLRVLRRMRLGHRKAISQRRLDEICTATGVGSINEFTWFTANDLVALGIWDPVQYVEGYSRVKGENVHFRSRDELREQKHLKASNKRKKRKR
jgi:hypothetical protein